MLLAIIITLFIAVLVPVYWKNYGVANFLWLSDLGLFITCMALWLQSPLLISMVCIGILPLELIWVADYFYQLITRRKLFGLSSYMFDAKYPLFLRNLSLFHLALPVIWIYYLLQWGYDTRAFAYQCMFIWVILAVTYFFTNPADNVNLVFMPAEKQWRRVPSIIWVGTLMVAFPVLMFLPLHWVYKLLAQ